MATYPSKVYRLIAQSLGGLDGEQLDQLVTEVEELKESKANLSLLNSRFSSAQRTAVNALTSESTAADIVAALQAS